MSEERFEELVSDALDLIPPKLAAAIDNVVVLVEDEAPMRRFLRAAVRATARGSRRTIAHNSC